MNAPDGLNVVPDRVEAYLNAATRGVVVLALDGLSRAAADRTLAHARVSTLRSTFPSTSTTAWLTAATGRDAGEHGAIGTVYRAPGAERVTHLITGRTHGYPPERAQAPGDEPGPLLHPAPTVFDRARAAGARPIAVAPELEALTGPWADALLHGAERRRAPRPRAAGGTPPTRPLAVVARAIREAAAVLDTTQGPPTLLWVYVNLDDHIHRHGYDADLDEALRVLDGAAARWADAGWSVLAHADHGQVAVRPSALLADRWAALDTPAHCRAPSGGAGRVRWLYPRPGRERRVAAELRDALAGHALVLTPGELAGRGLLADTPVVRRRIGEVVALATSAAFPTPDPAAAYEHGSTTDDEVLVPFAVWGAAHAPDTRRAPAATPPPPEQNGSQR